MNEISNIQIQRDYKEHEKSIIEIIYEVTEEICNHYCKYPDIWDEETQGELCESDICSNCPLNRL